MSNFFSSRTIKTGLLVGTLDITAACTQYYIKTGKGPENVLRYVASGAFGKEAFTSDSSMIFWGLFFHYVIAMSFTFFFFWLAKIFPGILRVKLLTAALYSVFMWCVTQFLVIPLSKIPTPTATLSGALISISILFVCIAIPLTWMAAKQMNTNK